MFNEAVNVGKPPAPPANAITPTGANEPPRSDQPSSAPLQLAPPAGGTGVGAEVLSAPSGSAPITGGAPNDGSAGMKAVGPTNTALPAAEKAAEAPVQINEVKSNGPTVTNTTTRRSPRSTTRKSPTARRKRRRALPSSIRFNFSLIRNHKGRIHRCGLCDCYRLIPYSLFPSRHFPPCKHNP